MRAPVAHFPPLRSGTRWLASRANGARLHAGVDLMAAAGTPVVAPERCKVVVSLATRTPSQVTRGIGTRRAWDGYGPGVVIVRGESGWFHLLGHSDASALPRVGTVFEEGERVTFVGPLNAPHTHWEVRAQLRPPSGRATVEVCADPFTWLAGAPHVWTPADGGPLRPGVTWRTPAPFRPAGSRRAPLEVVPPLPFDPRA